MLSENWKRKEKKLIYRTNANYDTFNDLDAYPRRYEASLIVKNKAGNKALELGCGSGVMTRDLIDHFDSFTVVDIWGPGMKKVKKTYGKRVKTHVAFIEEFKTKEKFSDIIISSTLEHVENPVLVLKKARDFLAPDGKIHIVVPHGRSLHRLIATTMGYLKKPNQLTKYDKRVGHRRIYIIKQLESDIKRSGLKIIHSEGVLIKFLPGHQMLLLGTSIINFFVKLGKYFPKIAGEIYIICSK